MPIEAPPAWMAYRTRTNNMIDGDDFTDTDQGLSMPEPVHKYALPPLPVRLGFDIDEGGQQRCADVDLDEQGCAMVSQGLQPAPLDNDHHDIDDEETLKWVANYEKKKFTVLQFFPPMIWVPSYIRSISGKATEDDKNSVGILPFSLKGDMIAGLTVGFMLVPQSLAFALLAGLPIQVGLYSSFAPLLMYSLFGTIRQVQPGPTALMSLITGQALDGMGLVTDADKVAGAACMASFVGLISVLLGVLRFGFIVDFMSHSVMAAFCSAAGVTIATSQLKHLVGIKMPRKKYWWQTASYLVTHLHEADVPTVVMGGTLLALLLFLKHWKGAGNADKRRKHFLWRWFPKDKKQAPFRVLKLIADMSSLLCVILGWFWGLVYREAGVDSVRVVGKIDSDGLTLVLPGNGIIGEKPIDSLLMSAAVMAVVGFLETVAVGGKFAMAARYEYDPNQELLALGLSNIAGAVMSGYPGTGSFSRTAVNAMFGATSLLACGMSSLVVLVSMYILLDVIAKLPLASLAPIIIQGAIGVVNIKDFKVAFKASRAEFMVMIATFGVSLGLSVKEGLGIGFVMSVMKTMNDLGNPNLAVCGRLPDGSFRDVRNFPNAVPVENTVIVRMDARLNFANSRKLKEFCVRAIHVRESQSSKIHYLIIDGKAINHVDLTGCEMLETLAESLESHDQQLIVANLKGPVTRCLASAGVPDAILKHKGHLCIDMDQAISIVKGGDAKKAARDMQEFLKRVQNATVVMQQGNHGFYQCATPKGMCANVQVGATNGGSATPATSSNPTSSSGNKASPEPPQV